MSNSLDQFFKDKLTDHALAPPASAWDRVKSGLSKKNNTPRVLRIAAALLLMGALTTALVWISGKGNSSESTLSKDGSSPQIAAPQQAPPVKKELAKRPPLKHKEIQVPAKTDYKKEVPIPDVEVAVAQSKARTEVEPQSGVQPEEAKIVASLEEKPIVLEYRLETIRAPRSEGEPALAAASTEKSSLQKVIDFARDAKNGESHFGVRQAKDELFALNFKKDKQSNHK
jgi:hypothetical protein